MLTSSRNETGFTLIETLIAMTLLAVSLLGLGQLILVALNQNKFAEYNTKAVEVATGKIEELQGLYNWQIQSGETAQQLTSGTHGPVALDLPQSEETVQGIRSFLVTWEVVDLTGGQKAITVWVSPIQQNRLRNKTVILTSHFSP